MREGVTHKLLLNYTIKYYQYNYSRKSDAFFFSPSVVGFFFKSTWSYW